MNITLNKTNFVNNILTPASKLADNLSLDFVSNSSNSITKTLVSSSDNSVIFLGEANCKFSEPFKCVVPDCKTFLRLFSSIQQDEATLQITSNTIVYKDDSFSFKYHLLDEGYMVEKKSISEEKLKQLEYDTTFTIGKLVLSEALRYNSIIPDAEKFYLYTTDSKVFAKLGDEQKSNTNEIVTELCKSYSGAELASSIPINIQNLHLMAFVADNTIDISVNSRLKIVKFATSNIQYIVSGLVK
jgi:hypothetical protein